MKITETCLVCGESIVLEGRDVVALLVAWDEQHAACRAESDSAEAGAA